MISPTTDSTAGASVFGSVHLGYIVIESERFADWRRFGRDAIGMHLDEVSADVIRFRLDNHETRFIIVRGPAEDVVALGWELDDHESFDRVVARVVDRGVPAVDGSEEETAIRGVDRLIRFPGPHRLAQEIVTRPHVTDRPLAMAIRGGFVTGASGMGHVAITSTRPQQMRGYYNTVFDARLTDYIDETISGARLKIRFLRVNERHHSIAIANVRGLPVNPIRTRVQHLNVEVASLDDLTAAYQRVTQLGFGMALSVGQHTNDKELSFYAQSPSGFEWEVGWKPIVVDESTWEPRTHQGISIWGHTPVGQTIIGRLDQFRRAAVSLREHEDPVPALAGIGIPDN
ncbi:VOC family protein [Gordonia sp. NPDC003376]